MPQRGRTALNAMDLWMTRHGIPQPVEDLAAAMPPRLSKHMGGWTAWGQGVEGKGGGPREDAAETQDITAAAASRRRLADMVLLVPARNPDRRLSSALVPHVAKTPWMVVSPPQF